MVSSGVRLSSVMIGKWSVWTGISSSFVSHDTTNSMGSDVHSTLSGCVRFPVALAHKVGIPGGSAIVAHCHDVKKGSCCIQVGGHEEMMAVRAAPHGVVVVEVS